MLRQFCTPTFYKTAYVPVLFVIYIIPKTTFSLKFLWPLIVLALSDRRKTYPA